MGCGCRGGAKRQSSRSKATAKVPTAVRRKQKSTCARLEALGNTVSVTIGSSGNIFLAPPLGNGSGLSVSSLLPSLGCVGAFGKSLLGAEVKTMVVFSSPPKLAKFRELIPHKTVKLGYLRSVLQHF
jgi:hypothetical protein